MKLSLFSLFMCTIILFFLQHVESNQVECLPSNITVCATVYNKMTTLPDQCVAQRLGATNIINGECRLLSRGSSAKNQVTRVWNEITGRWENSSSSE